MLWSVCSAMEEVCWLQSLCIKITDVAFLFPSFYVASLVSHNPYGRKLRLMNLNVTEQLFIRIHWIKKNKETNILWDMDMSEKIDSETAS